MQSTLIKFDPELDASPNHLNIEHLALIID